MNQRQAFLRAIATHRFDRLPRLAFADWLDEQGNADDAALSEFVRAQCRLSEMVEPHHATTWCDCEWCRLNRRATHLFDSGCTLGIYRPLGMTPHDASLAFHRDGFPDRLRLVDFESPLADLPGNVGRLFLLLPIRYALLRFEDLNRTRNRVEEWAVEVEYHPDSVGQGGKICGYVGPLVSGRFHINFRCEYPVDHPKRIPTLARKAARRCLTNRESESEGMTRRPAFTHTADRDPR